MSVGTLVPEISQQAAGAEATRTRALGTPTIAAVAALTVLAAVLRITGIGHQGFWFDEANTAQLVHFTPGKMLGLIPHSESTPPLYYCVAWLWARVFGYTEAPLRALSAVAGTAVVPVLYATGAKLSSRRAGLIVAALAACNPLLIWYSQEARSYSLLVLLSSISLLGFAYARDEPTPRAVTIWVVGSALAMCTHYYAVLLVVPETVWLLASRRRRRPLQIAVGVLAVWGLALLGLAIHQNATGHANWIATVPLGRRLGPMFGQLLIAFGSPAYVALEPLAVAIAICSLGLLVLRSDPLERRGGLIAGALALAGLVINLVLVAGGVDDLLARNALALWAPAAVAVAAGLAAARARLVGLVGAAVLCAIGIVAAAGVATDRNLQRPDWRVVASALGRHPGPSAAPRRAILVQHYRDLLPLSLYLRGMKFMSSRGATVGELDVVTFTSPPTGGFCWWGSACNLWPSHAQRSYAVTGFREISRRHVLQFTVIRLVPAHPLTLTPHEVSRVLRTTRFRNDELLVQR